MFKPVIFSYSSCASQSSAREWYHFACRWRFAGFVGELCLTGKSQLLREHRAVSAADGYRISPKRLLRCRCHAQLGRVSRLEEAAQTANLGDRLDLRQIDVADFDSIPAAID